MNKWNERMRIIIYIYICLRDLVEVFIVWNELFEKEINCIIVIKGVRCILEVVKVIRCK